MDGVLKGLRPYISGDLPALARLLAEARAWPPASVPTEEDIATRWRRRGVVPQDDVSVLPAPDGGLTAYLQMARGGHGTPRLSFEIAVLPAYQRRGIAQGLYKLVEARARHLNIAHLTSPVFSRLGETRTECASFLEHRGFRVDSGYWQMRIDGLPGLPRPSWPPGIACRTFGYSAHDAERWAQLIRECFREQATAQGVLAQLTEEGVSRDGYFFAVDASTGVEVGTSRARIDVVNGQRLGYVGTVGVLPEYRGRGIAEALVWQTLAYLATQGTTSATLFVENANYAARALYEKMGWYATYRTDHYWKHLPLPPEFH
jgi:mycothiol synthase